MTNSSMVELAGGNAVKSSGVLGCDSEVECLPTVCKAQGSIQLSKNGIRRERRQEKEMKDTESTADHTTQGLNNKGQT